MTTSAYIHIPFCKSKCKYCSFISYTDKTVEQQSEYINTLLKEIDFFYKKEPLKTLYIGGGTPSLLDISDLKKIIGKFKFDSNPEITIEINPETVDKKYLSGLYMNGFNRLSVGIQSFDNKILQSIGRIHTAQRALQTVKNAKEAGFKNISLDFIYGLPAQTLDMFIKDLELAVKMEISHISLYGLKIEEGCSFFNFAPKHLPDDDTQADMYLAAIDILEHNGFSHYEISNFARCGFESKHNLNYWNDREYYGFGAAAHGYISPVRYSNYRSIEEYQKKYKEKDVLEKIDETKHLEETIFLGFRKAEGIDVQNINKIFNIDFEYSYRKILKKYLESGHLRKTESGYKLSNEGFLISNFILADFIDC